MHSAQQDLSVLEKLHFERKPVGIKFLLNKPAALEQLDKRLSFCQMFKDAQDSFPFYATQDNFACLESMLLGVDKPDPIFESGQIGAKEKIFQEARANRRIYQYLPKLAKNTVRYIAFASLDKLCFKPDVLVITANPPQAEILFRAISYSTGRALSSKWTPVIMCAWIFIYPFISGEINYTVTGLGYGMKSKKLLPEGLLLISIPYDLIPMVIGNLQEMEWDLQIYTLNDDERLKYSRRVMDEIRQEYLSR